MAQKKAMLDNPKVPEECQRPPFKASEIPASCATKFYHIDLKQKEQDREARIRKNAEDRLEMAEMPKGMKQAYEKT